MRTSHSSRNGARPMDWQQEATTLQQQLERERQQRKSEAEQSRQQSRDLQAAHERIRVLEDQVKDKATQKEHWEQQIRHLRQQLQDTVRSEEKLAGVKQDLELCKVKLARVQEENRNLKLEQERRAQAPPPEPIVDQSKELFAHMQREITSECRKVYEGLLAQQNQMVAQLTRQMTEMQQTFQSALAQSASSPASHSFPPASTPGPSMYSSGDHRAMEHRGSGHFPPPEPAWPPAPRPYCGYETLTRM